MEYHSVRLIICACIAGAFLSPACKSANSSAKSIPIENIDHLTLEQWTTACQKELDDPTTGAASKKELIQLANTPDCAAAFGVIKQIIDYATKKSA